MSRTKIDYGIDLGTTNSAISRMEGGHPSIIKADDQKDTMPSCVAITRKQAVRVGNAAVGAYNKEKVTSLNNLDSDSSNAFIEFKRTMGTDKKYTCANAEKDFSSEELSAEVLKALRSFVVDEQVNSAVVTIPAKFTINQKDATLRAALMAGLTHCELLQEPIAASTAYALSSTNKDGNWLVFDFGGGTFDAAIVSVEEGIMKIVDTEGDNYLGGKNLDNTIVNEIIIPHIRDNYDFEELLNDDGSVIKLQEAMKIWAERAKIALSFSDTFHILSDIGDFSIEDSNGEVLELDIVVTRDCLEKAIGPLFQKAIGLCLHLLERNGMSNNDLAALILVGGPTFSPILRDMLSEQLIEPDTSVDPMTVVSTGAALFASTLALSDEIIEGQRDDKKVQLVINYEPTTVESEEFVTLSLEEEASGERFVEVVRDDGAWSSGKTPINSQGDVVEVALISDRPNSFSIHVYDEKGDRFESQPNSFSILQGAQFGSATLNYSFGIEVKDILSGEIVFRSIKGLEKNQSVPATGTSNGLTTQKEVRPGMIDDTIRIPIYQGGFGADGSKAIYNEFVYEAIITGADLPALLPSGSEVDLVLKVVSEKKISFSVFFPSLDEEIELEVPTDSTQNEIDSEWLGIQFDKAKSSLKHIREEGDGTNESEVSNLEAELHGLENNLEEGKGDYDRKKEVLNGLRKSLKKIDALQSLADWPNAEAELVRVFDSLEENNSRFGNEQTTAIVAQIKSQVEEVILDRNVKVAKDLISLARGLNFKLVDEGLGAQMEIMWIRNYHEEFDILDWSDRGRARQIVDEGLRLSADNPTKESLRRIVVELNTMLPDADKPILESGQGDELIG